MTNDVAIRHPGHERHGLLSRRTPVALAIEPMKGQ